METNFTEQDSLKVITEMIENSRAKIRDNGFFYLLWGWLVLIASVTNFILLIVDYEKAWLPWPILMIGGGIASGIAGYKLGKNARVKTLFDTAMIYLWSSFLVLLFIILFMAAKGTIPWIASNALIIALYGLGTFMSGGLLKFKPLIFGGVVSWALAIITLFIPDIYSLLTIALSIIIAYLIPGYMLKTRDKNLSYV